MILDAPLTPMQQRVWFVEASSPGRPDFNICTAHRLRGRIDPDLLRRAFHAMAQAHGALCLRFHTDQSGEVRQSQVGELPELEVESAQGLNEAQWMSRLTAIRQAPFDLSGGPLCRARLLMRDEGEAVFIFVGHHLICDGWSMMVLAEAMSRGVAALQSMPAGDLQANEADAPMSGGVREQAYLAFAQQQHDWLSSAAADAEMSHWLASLTPMPEPLALSRRAAGPSVVDESAPQLGDQAGIARIQVPMSASTLGGIRRLARSLDVSMFSVLLAAYALVLGRSAGQRDMAIGVPVKGRHSPELDGVIGFFANTLPVRLSWQADATFAELAAQASHKVKEAMAHAALPFERLIQRLPVQRDSGRHPIYQAQFSYVDLRRRTDRWGELARSSISVPTFGGAEELALLLIERQDDSLLEWCVHTDVVPEAMARRLMRRFLTVLDALVRPQAATQTVQALDWMDDAERQELLCWSQGPSRQVAQACVWDLLKQAPAVEQAPALLVGERWLSRGELFGRASRMAAQLAAHGVKPGMRVGLLLQQGPWVTQAILAVWACRAAYVPLDPSHPPERLRMVLDDADCGFILVDEACDDVGGNRLAELRDGDQAGPSAAAPAPTWIRLDVNRLLPVEDEGGVPVAVDLPASLQGQSADVAYIMFTSGSTGRPKGVVVTQGAVVNLLTSLRETLSVQAGDRWLAVTTPSFDISVLESFLPMVSGASLAWASAQQAQDGAALASLWQRHGITCLQGTPATWALLCAQPGLPDLSPGASGQVGGRFLALVGGEALPAVLAGDMLARGLDVWNMYGPTETTVWSTCMRLTPQVLAGGIPVGHPIANTVVSVLDEGGSPCPSGVRGQIYIGGGGVAQGYWRRDDLTAAQFVNLTSADEARPMRFFAVGDVGEWDEQGRLHCLGRLDRQMKWRGFRIEPEEIEGALARLTACRAVVVKLVEASAGALLVAFIEGGGEHTPQALREGLSAVLPSYMVPARFVMLKDGMPRLPNGKVDYRVLDASLISELAPTRTPDVQGDRSEVAQALWEIWREVLHTDDIRPEDNFFDLGGHSLLALKAANLMAQRLGVQLGPQKYVFENFQQLASSYERALTAQAADAAGSQPGADQPGEGGALDLIRRRLRGVLAWGKSGT